MRDLAVDYLETFGDFKYLGYAPKSDLYLAPDIFNEKITLHQIEMWLCEFQKYWKMKIGEGKQRSKFEPKTKVKIIKSK